MGKESVKGAGTFVFWDCAGQIEYRLTHGMFLGVNKTIFVVLFDITKGNKVSLICHHLVLLPTHFHTNLTKIRLHGTKN